MDVVALEARLEERLSRIAALEQRLDRDGGSQVPEPAAALGADLTRDVRDRLATLAGDLDAIGGALDETARACDAARRTLQQRVVPATQRLVDLSAGATTSVPHLALDPSAPRALASGDD